jgi:hypothetical protein
MPQRGDERLGARIDAKPLQLKRHRRAIVQQTARRQLREQRLAHDQIQAGVPARQRMAHAIAFAAIEEQHLVGFGDCLVPPEPPDIHAAIRKDDVRGRGVFVGGGVPAGAGAPHVANGDRGRCQERMCFDVGHRRALPVIGYRP